jgi:hypothetical protein
MISARIPANRTQALVSVVVLGLSLWSAWIIGGWVFANDEKTLALVALAIAGVVIALRIAKDWRTGLYSFFVWLLFEDLARKYLGNNMAIYFGKDVLVALVYVFFFVALRRGKEPILRLPFLVPLGLFVWLGLLQCFNPNSPSLLYSLLGFKLYFFYIPLVFVGYALVRNEKDLERFLAINLGLAGIIALLGIIQGIVGASFLNPPVLAPELQLLGKLYRYTSTGTKIYRPNSVFVSDGRFASYMMLAWILGMGAAGFFLLRQRQTRRFIYPAIGLILVAIMLSGSRGNFTLTIINSMAMAAAFLWGTPWRWTRGHQLIKVVRRTFLIGGLSLLLTLVLYPEAVGARWELYTETLSPFSEYSELGQRTWSYPIDNLMVAFRNPQWPYGQGIGTASLGMQYVSKWLGQRMPEGGVESGWGTLVVEMGILGLVLWLVWATAATLSCWKVVRQLRQSVYFPIAFAIFWYAFLLTGPLTFSSMGVYENYILNAYLWLLIGILFRLPALAAPTPVVLRRVPDAAGPFDGR